MLAFLAFVLGIVALVIALNARRDARELRAQLSAMAIRLARAEERADEIATSPTEPEPEPRSAVAAASALAETLQTAPASAEPQMPPPPPPQREPQPEPQPAAGIPPAAPPPIPESQRPPIPPYAAPQIAPQAAPQTAPQAASSPIDWESLVGIKLFGWIAGIALVLAAVFLFKYSIDHGWLRPAVRATLGFITGIGLLVVCELRVARNYKFTANAMLGAGIAILYATLFALYGRWQLWPATASFAGMVVVTAIAVFLSTRRDSIFIALLGLLGGFATPALLSSGENRPIALFSYLLLLNGGISWIAYRKRWPLLTALSVLLTAIYQWAWVEKFLDSAQLPLAATIFAVFGIVAAAMLWQQAEGDARKQLFRGIGGAGAVLPLLFAFFTAIVPEYGARFHILFAFLLLMVAGLTAIALWRGPRWLHGVAALAALLTFFIWLVVSYTPQSWPWSLVWLAVFIVLFLAVRLKLEGIAVYAAPLLFFVFIGIAVREDAHATTLIGAMLAMLVILAGFAAQYPKWGLVPIALALASSAVMSMDLVTWPWFAAAQLILFAALFAVAWIGRIHWLALAALPFLVAVVIRAGDFGDARQLLLGALLYALFLLYPATLGARIGRSLTPHIAVAAASAIFLSLAYGLREQLGYDAWMGVIPVLQAMLVFGLMVLLLRIEPLPLRLVTVASTILALLTIAVPMQFENEWLPVAWAVEALALAWLQTRLRHNGLLFWIGGVSVAALLAMAVDFRPANYAAMYLLCAAAMFAIARIEPVVRPLYATLGTIELFLLLNVAIDDYYRDRVASTLARDLTYTFGWALFAIAMLVAGIILRNRAARIAAL
ncbi:MAG TPA: DUF2339 domain-containing protein, partial [Thermoanaerobaculia bacterium]|nr:DUF2339 domain-containing protein [Thermoanaerobaculia bacterium]